MRQTLLIGLIFVHAMLAGTTNGLAFDHKLVAETSLANHIRPSYVRLQSAVNALDKALVDYCAHPSAATSDPVYASYTKAVMAWGRVEHIRFGPVTEQHRYERFVFWPDAKALGKKQVLRTLRKMDENVLEQSKLAKKSVALQGLTALEVILYSKKHERTFGPEAVDPFRCGYAKAISANLIVMAEEIVTAWSIKGRYTRLWFSPGPDNPLYLSEKEVTQELVRSYSAGLEQTREKRLVEPMGIRHTQKVPGKSPFEHSNLTMPFLIANVEGLQDLFVNGGLMGALNASHPGRGDSLGNEFRFILAALNKIDVHEPRPLSHPSIFKRLIPIGFPMKNLLVLGTAYLSEAAGLSLGFNASDGD